jgi:glycosyltransferase involved in cell wall biosynthesis
VYPGVVEDEGSTSTPICVPRDNSILYVSRFEKRKNHLALLNSLLELRQWHPGLRMVLVGFEIDGTLAQVREFITRHGLDGAVDIRSNIGDAELENLYRTAGVVAYPSFGEGFGMPVIEAFLLNSNTLFSRCTAMAEFTFAPNNTFDPTDGAAITAKIDVALRARSTPPPEWQEQRQRVVEKYNWRKSAKILANLYHADASVPSLAL